MRILIPCFVTASLLFSVYASSAQPLIVKDIPDPKEQLLLDILKLVISKSPNASNYSFKGKDLNVTEARLASLLKDNEISVMWAGIQQKYENELLPIRIPALKGMLGHRIFIIRKGDQSKFDRVKTLDDLRKIPLGQGRFWGDTAILKHNKLNVVDPVKYLSLIRMLDGGRFDYFPRGLHEPWAEVTNFSQYDFEVEKKILIVYPFGMYFYVNKNNTKLAEDIYQGFEIAIEDGSYDALFYNHPMIKDALDKTNIPQRTIFRLENPYLPQSAPIDDKRLWLDLETNVLR